VTSHETPSTSMDYTCKKCSGEIINGLRCWLDSFGPYHFECAHGVRLGISERRDEQKVICPNCVHEFAAIPAAVQEELAALKDLVLRQQNTLNDYPRLRKDAERYRWLRDVGDATWPAEADAAIDAAIERGPVA
jgi:hypothetical protein